MFRNSVTAFVAFQVGLRLKVCRGDSVRKVLVQEAKTFGVSTVILGTSKSHHTIRSSAWVAKYCAKKLPKCISVFSVDNGKIAFRREANGNCGDRGFDLFSFLSAFILVFYVARCCLIICALSVKCVLLSEVRSDKKKKKRE